MKKGKELSAERKFLSAIYNNFEAQIHKICKRTYEKRG